jgi:proline iminopeptidase
MGGIFHGRSMGPACRRQDLLNDPNRGRATLTRERMVAAAEEMTNWARRELDKEKSFVVGHSWGKLPRLGGGQASSRLAACLYRRWPADRRPESERRGWAFALDAARRAGNLEAVRELEAIDILQIFVLSSGIVIAGQSSIARRET